MPTLLIAIKNIVFNPIINIRDYYKSKNRANNTGEALEEYIKDCFANTFNLENEMERILKYSKIFSYLGNQNNPPDMILKDGDALEVKKIESFNKSIPLNSSYPKSKLNSENPMLTKSCKECEDWQEKDIIYFIGCTKDSKLKSLWIVYGDCYAANEDIYKTLIEKIVVRIRKTPGIKLSSTKELGKVKKVDPLGITDLRIRGMWDIRNPNYVFSYITSIDKNANFQLKCLMTSEKYMTFSKKDRKLLEGIVVNGFSKKDIKIKNPNNPAQLVDSILIEYKN